MELLQQFIAAANDYLQTGFYKVNALQGLLIAGVAAVFAWDQYKPISFLWYNLIGCVVVVAVGMLISLMDKKTR